MIYDTRNGEDKVVTPESINKNEIKTEDLLEALEFIQGIPSKLISAENRIRYALGLIDGAPHWKE